MTAEQRQLCNPQAQGSWLEKLRVQFTPACDLSLGPCRSVCCFGGLQLRNMCMQWGLCDTGCYRLGATNPVRGFASLQHPSAGLHFHLEPTPAPPRDSLCCSQNQNDFRARFKHSPPPFVAPSTDTSAVLCHNTVPELSHLLQSTRVRPHLVPCHSPASCLFSLLSHEAWSCGEAGGPQGTSTDPPLTPGSFPLSWQHAEGGRDHPVPRFKIPTMERKRREGPQTATCVFCHAPPAELQLLNLHCTGSSMGCNSLWKKRLVHAQITL